MYGNCHWQIENHQPDLEQMVIQGRELRTIHILLQYNFSDPPTHLLNVLNQNKYST